MATPKHPEAAERQATREHLYSVRIRWTGNRGDGTSTYTGYERSHEIEVAGKPLILGSADPAFRGDPCHHNPEELLVASLSACHMLWYLHLCADAGLVVSGYRDDCSGTMVETVSGGGRFAEVVLRPTVTVQCGTDPGAAIALHAHAHELCFIARSVSFPVRCEPTVVLAPEGP